MTIISVKAVIFCLIPLVERGSYPLGGPKVFLVSCFHEDLRLRYVERSVLMKLLELVLQRVLRPSKSVSIEWLIPSLFIPPFNLASGGILSSSNGLLGISILLSSCQHLDIVNGESLL